jgi:hypothetical protein
LLDLATRFLTRVHVLLRKECRMARLPVVGVGELAYHSLMLHSDNVRNDTNSESTRVSPQALVHLDSIPTFVHTAVHVMARLGSLPPSQGTKPPEGSLLRAREDPSSMNHSDPYIGMLRALSTCHSTKPWRGILATLYQRTPRCTLTRTSPPL